MKKFLTLIIVLLTVVSVLTACDVESKDKFTVSFIVDGETFHSVKSAGYEKIELPDEPQKNGYVFEGWYLDRWIWKDKFDGDNYVDTAIMKDVKV